MTGLRVIIVAPEPPDPFGNAAARWYFALAKGLVLRGHRPLFLSGYAPNNSEESLNRARAAFAQLNVPLSMYRYQRGSWPARKWRTLMQPYSHFISDELRGDLAKHLRSGCDVLNLEQMWAGYLGIGVERSLLSVHHLELLDLAGTSSPSWKLFVSKRLMFRAETTIVKKSPRIRATTDRLRTELSKMNPSATVFTVPVAIEPELYEFTPAVQEAETIGLIASFNWTPGANAGKRLLTRIWPRIKRAIPGAKLLVVGWHARSVLQQFIQSPDVTIIENVPDTKEYFRRLAVLVYPLTQGSGMKIKLLEAMALGVPVATTSEGAEGLELADGHEACVIDDDEQLAEKVVWLVRDRAAAKRMARAARSLVEERYSPMPVVSRLEPVYQQVIDGVV